MRPPLKIAYRLGWLMFGVAGFFAPDWTSGRFADSMLNAWPDPAWTLPLLTPSENELQKLRSETDSA